MPVAIWRGDAVAVSQVTKITPGTVVIGNTYSLVINGKRVTVTAGTALPSDLVDDLVDAISASSIPEFQELIADGFGSYLTLTSNEAGTPFIVTTLSGDFETDEYQVVTIAHAPTGGTFTLTWFYLDNLGVVQSETTATIAYNASAATVQTELEALTHIGSGNVLVTGEAGGPYTIHFTGTLARQDVRALVADGSALTGGDAVLNVSTIQAAVAGTDEVQTITLYGSLTGGTFTLSFRGATTAPIAYNAGTAAVQSALQALATIGSGNATVSGSAGAWVVTFANALGHRAVDELVIASNLTGGTIYATTATTTNGAAGINQINYLTYRPFADTQAYLYVNKTTFSGWSAGGWYITINGDTSNLIAWDATDTEIAAAIEVLLGSAGVLVTSNNPQIYIRLAGPLLDLTISSFSVLSTITGGSVSAGGYTSGVDGGSPTPGGITYKFTVNGVDSAAIDRTASASDIQAALVAVVGNGNIIVTNLEGTIFTEEGLMKIEFTGALSSTFVVISVTDIGIDPAGATEIELYQYPAASGANELQTLVISGSPSQGWYRLNALGEWTDWIPYNATAVDIEAELLALDVLNVGDVEVTGSAGSFTFTFGASLSYTDVPQITVDDSLLVASVVTTTPGVTGKNEIQRLSIAGQDVWGGTLTLTFGANTTAALAYTLTALQAHTALEGLASLGAGTISATHGPFPENYIDIEFTGSKAETNVGAITGTTTSLKNSTIEIDVYDPVIVEHETEATGPNHWNDPTNWTTGAVPQWGDAVLISEGASDILYGLRQMSPFTVDAVNDEVIPAGVDLVEGQKVRVWNIGGGLPAGLAANTDYYVLAIDPITQRFGLAASSGGAAIDITSSGTGTHYIGVRLSAVSPSPAFYLDARYTGRIGLPQRSDNDYWEYRPRYLVIGLDPAGSSTVILGQGDGSGSGLVRLNTGTDQVSLEVLSSSGSYESGVPPINWLGINSANVVTVYDGELGIAFCAGEVSTLNKLLIRAGEVTLGDVTFAGTAPMLDRTGGECRTKDSVALSGVFRMRG